VGKVVHSPPLALVQASSCPKTSDMDADYYDLETVARLTPEAKLRVLSGLIEQAWALKEAWPR